MLKLIKFEFSRKKTMYLVAAILLVIAQAFVLYKYLELGSHVRDEFGLDIFGAYAGILMVAFSILYLIDIIFLFREDLFKQEGYMLFMTPNSGYKLLGAKLLFALLEGVLIFGVYSVIILSNIKFMNVDVINFVFKNLSTKEFWIMAKGLFAIILMIMQFSLVVYLSFALFKSIFSNTRFKGLITFGIFIVLNIAISKIQELLSYILPFESRFNVIFNENSTMDAVNISLNNGVFMSVVSVIILFIGTGYLLEKKINL